MVAAYFQVDLKDRFLTPIDIRNTNRLTLADFFHFANFKYGAEIGVEQGEYSEELAKRNPQLVTLYGVDPWKAYPGYREHVTQSKLDAFFVSTVQRMAQYPYWYPLRNYSVQAAQAIADNSLDFVYIDGNHDFLNTTQDLAAWTPKVKSGGIIAGHDFRRISTHGYNCHVVEVVMGWTRAYNIKPWFLLGAKDKVEGELRDNSRSFFWVKP